MGIALLLVPMFTRASQKRYDQWPVSVVTTVIFFYPATEMCVIWRGGGWVALWLREPFIESLCYRSGEVDEFENRKSATLLGVVLRSTDAGHFHDGEQLACYDSRLLTPYELGAVRILK